MRILITNDDGINAPGLIALHEIATELAGPKGEVWTVAPAFEQSGVGQCSQFARVLGEEQISGRFVPFLQDLGGLLVIGGRHRDLGADLLDERTHQ